MTEVELYSEVRELIGNPSVNEVSNRQLRKYLIPSLEWLAAKLKYVVVTDDTAIALTAGQLDYPLPPEVGWIVWVEWSTNKLDPGSTYGWEREGLDWRDTAANQPTAFAVQGRKLILNPPPSADAIATDPTLSIRYLSTTPGLAAGGPPMLGQFEQQILVYKAAIRYCVAHPSPENGARASGYQSEVNSLMSDALARAHNPIEDYQETFHVKTRRFGGAR